MKPKKLILKNKNGDTWSIDPDHFTFKEYKRIRNFLYKFDIWKLKQFQKDIKKKK